MGIIHTGLQLGLRPGATWHTAVALDAGSKLMPANVGPLSLQQEKFPEETNGYEYIRRQDLGRIMQEINFGGVLRYENSQWIHICQLIGTETGSVAAGVYTHQLDIDGEIDGVFYTAAGILRHSTLASSEIFEWPSVKPISWEISVGDGGFMQFSGVGIADCLLDTGHADIVNTTTTIGTTSTIDSESLRIPFGHCRVNINDQDGADFNSSGDGTDRVYPIGLSISMSRPLERDFDANRLAADSGTADTYKTSEPVQTGMVKDIFVTLEFSEMENNDYIEELRGNTAKKAEIYFYDTADRNLKFQFPNLLYEDISVDSDGANRIPQTVTFRACEVSDGSTAPTGMTGITKPFRMTLENSWSKQYDDHSAIT